MTDDSLKKQTPPKEPSETLAQQAKKKKTLVVAAKPMSAEEEVELQRWIESRRRNFPTKQKLEDKGKDQERRSELGIKGVTMAQGEDVSNLASNTVERPQLSKIELKLRRKLRLIVG